MRRNEKEEYKFSRYAAKLGLTIPDLETLCNAAAQTWQYIGCDCLQAMGGKDIRRAVVIELVLDADHILTNSARNLSEEVKGVLRSHLFGGILTKVLKDFVFPYDRYGM
jgi:hypothetical protein